VAAFMTRNLRVMNHATTVNTINLIFFGTTSHSKIISDALRADGHFDIRLTLSPSDLENPELVNQIILTNPVVGVVVDFGRLIPKNIIDIFPKGIINLHPSLLPKHRGAIPAVGTILDGDKISGISVIVINEKFDNGAILLQVETPVLPDDIPATLYDRLFTLGSRVLTKAILEYVAGKVTPTPQPTGNYPYEKRLTKESGRIDWSESDDYLERFVRAMTPWPGAWTTVSELVSKSNPSFPPTPPNPSLVKLLRTKLNPAGKLEILEVQLEGKKPITWAQFKNGYH